MRKNRFLTSLQCVAIALAAAFLLAGCGSTGGSSPSTETGQAEQGLDEEQEETGGAEAQEEAENVLGSKGGWWTHWSPPYQKMTRI
ncbi:MAG: hypothetical protein IJU50_06135 [Lachnospiraceae bacterium]|nr:hypothetical protein [Lachnospiraceae bacterium]